MSNIPKFIEESKALQAPFDKNGTPTLATSILATLLPNKPLTKETLLAKIDEKHTGKSRGYLSNIFSELSKAGIIKFDKRVQFRTWEQGENYQQYMGYIFMELVKLEPASLDSLQFKLMPKKKEQSMDFIMSPKEDIFSQPNPLLEEDKPKKSKSATRTVADNYLDLHIA